MDTFSFAGVVALCFFVGGIPFGFIVGKFKGVDLRKVGSGNIGATNVLRVLGVFWGVVVLILDALKGAVPVIIIERSTDSHILTSVAGFSLILGHVFSPYLKFKGGKGVATSLGVFVSLIPIPVFISAVVFFVVVWISRYVSLGSIVASVVLPLTSFLLSSPVEYSALALIVGLVVLVRHRANIVRILNGTENKIGG